MEVNQLAVLNDEINDNAQALIVGVKNERLAISLSSVIAIENVQLSDINSVNNEDVIDHRGKIIPLVYLDKVFELNGAEEERDSINVVVCTNDDSTVGLVVDTLFGQSEIEEKSLGTLSDNEFFTGVSILPEMDEVALVLNLDSLVA